MDQDVTSMPGAAAPGKYPVNISRAISAAAELLVRYYQPKISRTVPVFKVQRYLFSFVYLLAAVW